uniref:Uncharacterized protein n=1 Tax=Hyaloperonospora arabidopsidis (strain Emoy2) TaxID=559515 RepID=M4C1V0_HYAAE
MSRTDTYHHKRTMRLHNTNQDSDGPPAQGITWIPPCYQVRTSLVMSAPHQR